MNNANLKKKSEQRTQETDAMDVSARTRVRVCADECLRREKIFLLYKFTDSFAFWGNCCEKQSKSSGVKKLGSHSF